MNRNSFGGIGIGIKIIGVILLFVFLAGGILGYQTAVSTSQDTIKTVTTTIKVTPEPTSEVTILGTVTTKTFGTSAVSIEFIDKSGMRYSEDLVDNMYEIRLSNKEVYDVEIEWTGLIKGTCNAGSLPIFIGSEDQSPIEVDWSC